MKKYILISLLVIILSLTACTGQTNQQTAVSNTSEKCPQSVLANSSSNIAVGETGYYTLNGMAQGKYLSYISKSGAKSTYLCSKPECRHMDDSGYFAVETCNAYVGEAVPQSIVYHNGYVYVLEYNERTYNVTLVRISQDGSVHEKIMEVGQAPSCSSYYEYAFADDNTIFMVYNAPDNTGEVRSVSLDKIDLSKKEKTPVYTYNEEGAIINYIKILNNDIFFKQSKKADDKSSYGLMMYDMQSGKVSTLLEGNIISYTIVNDGKIFYYIAEDGMYSLDLNTMQSQKIRECDEETMYVMLAFDGTYLYLDNMLNKFFYSKSSEHRIFVCDLEGNNVNTVPTGIECISVSDSDYMFRQESSGVEGTYWMYIKKSDIKNAHSWNKVEKVN